MGHGTEIELLIDRAQNDWVQTFTGQKLHFLTGPLSEITIEDIARGLSQRCRWSGMYRRAFDFFCPTPDQRVLTADLRWVPAGDLKVGTALVGFDEHPVEMGACGQPRRRYRPSFVAAHAMVRRRVFRVHLDDGTSVTCSGEHPWLTTVRSASRKQAWMSVNDMAMRLDTSDKRYTPPGMVRFVPPWADASNGWLEGMFDGEGYVSFANRGGVLAGVAQNPGPELDRLAAELALLGIPFSAIKTGKYKTVSLQLRGGTYGTLRALGTIRSARLLRKFKGGLIDGSFDKHLQSPSAPLGVVRIEDIGEQWVAGMETSTHTYFCEGFGAHNSVAQHSVYAARLAPPRARKLALLHDAAEWLTGDMSKPIKMHVPDFVNLEDKIMDRIAQRFKLKGSPSIYGAVKTVDNWLLWQEGEQLLENPALLAEWHVPRLSWPDAPKRFRIKPPGWSPRRAEIEFLRMYRDLWGVK